MKPKFCPDPALPGWETETPHDYSAEPRNLEWLVWRDLKCSIPSNSALGEAIALKRNPRPSPADPIEAFRWTKLSRTLQIADWSVRALCAQQDPRHQVKVSIDKTFLTKELLGADNPTAVYQQPNSITTLYTAARFAQGGRIILNRLELREKKAGTMRITGNGAGGYDVLYDSPMGLIIVECKQRPFQDGLEDAPPDQSRYVVGKITKASTKLPRDTKAGRVVVVGFQTGAAPLLLSRQQAEMYRVAVFSEFFRTQKDPAWPDCVIVEHADLRHSVLTRLNLRRGRTEFESVLPVIQAAMPETELVMRRDVVNGRIAPVILRRVRD
jgi:hypothetical protein